MFKTVNFRVFARAATIGAAAASFILAGCSEMLSREDFAARVKDKSDAEVAKVVGKPASVDQSAPDKVTWTYTSRTFNIEQGNKFDNKTIVVFNKAADGKLVASNVAFE